MFNRYQRGELKRPRTKHDLFEAQRTTSHRLLVAAIFLCGIAFACVLAVFN